MVYYIYITTGQAQTTPCVICFKNIYLVPIWSFAASFIHSMTLYKFSTFKRTGDPIWPCRKIGQGQPRLFIYIYFVELESPMLHVPSFKTSRLLVLEQILKCYYHIWAWRPSRSCDLDHLYEFSFPFHIEAQHEIWL